MNRDAETRDVYLALLWGEILLFGLLGASLALFVSSPELRNAYELPELRLFTQTAMVLAGTVVAILAGVRFAVEGRRLDLLLASGFFVAATSTFFFSIAPTFSGRPVAARETWAEVGARVVAAGLIAAAPLVPGRIVSRERALRRAIAGWAVVLLVIWAFADALSPVLPLLEPSAALNPPEWLVVSLAAQATLYLVALAGFVWRYRKHGRDLDRFLALGATFLLFASLHYVFTPLVSSREVSHADFLRLLAYGLLLVGVWRAIRSSEFGRAVAEERARVAREIHDGLAQYLFAVSTGISMLESGAELDATLPRLKEAAAAAQQEARFAVLALSSASGTAPFDAALRRYVEFLTADGALEVELEIEPQIHLAPDEQIEVFRIVQEGLGNVRRHAGARRAEVRIVEHGGRRVVSVRDDGEGFDGEERPAGQGLKNIRVRAARIGAAFALRSRPGGGTLLEVTLRA